MKTNPLVSIIWFSFLSISKQEEVKETLLKLQKNIFFGDFKSFYKHTLQVQEDVYAVVFDNYYWSFCLPSRDSIVFADTTVDDQLKISPIDFVLDSLQFPSLGELGKVTYPDINSLDLYKQILKTYKTEVFFEPFNTFKYKISKEFRKDYEELFYNYFAGILSGEDFKKKLKDFEKRLKPGQLLKYQGVKKYLESNKCEILKDLVLETDSKVVKQALEKHSIDYFDLNYLKAFLRDFGKPKTNARRKHNLKLENEGETIVDINEFKDLTVLSDV
jgi:hypothetical protein